MYKIILLFFVFLSFLDASIIKNVEVIERTDRSLNIEDIKESKDFKRTKLPFVRHSSNIFFLKISFDKNSLGKKLYTIDLDTEFNNIAVEKDVEYINVYKNKVFDQSFDNFTETIFIKINNSDKYVNFNINIYEANEYVSKELLLSKLYGISYGLTPNI